MSVSLFPDTKGPQGETRLSLLTQYLNDPRGRKGLTRPSSEPRSSVNTILLLQRTSPYSLPSYRKYPSHGFFRTPVSTHVPVGISEPVFNPLSLYSFPLIFYFFLHSLLDLGETIKDFLYLPLILIQN